MQLLFISSGNFKNGIITNNLQSRGASKSTMGFLLIILRLKVMLVKRYFDTSQ